MPLQQSFDFTGSCDMEGKLFCKNTKNRRRAKEAEEIFSYKNLLKCYYKCRKGKRLTVNSAKFELNFESELLKLQRELKTHTYKPGRSICFIVSRPKAREIFAADFRDRIIHHVLVDYLESIWEPMFIAQSYACRNGKGAHRAIVDLKKYIRSVSSTNRDKTYYIQLDIRSFFVSLNKDILFELLKKKVKNKEILWLAETIIFHNPTSNFYCKSSKSLFKTIPDHKTLFKVPANQGLPIGNLTSQFFANIYLNELDQFVKHRIKAKYYMRYVDDFLILSKDKDELKRYRDEISEFLHTNLKLRLHPEKQILQSIDKGINFVGFVVKDEYVLMRRRVVRNLKEKLFELNSGTGKFTEEEVVHNLSVVNSYFGQFKHAKTFGLRQKLWQKDFGVLQNFIKPVDKNLSYFQIK